MKKIKYIIVFILSIGLFNSCLIDDEATHDDYDKGPNFAGFLKNNTFVSAVSDGNEYTFELELLLQGPTSKDITSDVVLTIGVDESSTAKEGVHYKIENSIITLPASNNHLAKFEFTLITDGIDAPLDVTPELIFEVLDVTGAENVIATGKKISVDLNYLCFSNLSGTYTDSNWGDDVVITELGSGYYEADKITYFVNSYTWQFTDVCNKLTYAGGQLTDWNYDLWGAGSVDPATGTITFTLSADGIFEDYTMILTKQ